GCFLWGIFFPCHKINLQTGKSILHQFEGLHKLWDTSFPHDFGEILIYRVPLYVSETVNLGLSRFFRRITVEGIHST
ncbi:hypothetical protein, partial [Mordavella massiliensis]|uniref:hypothetical protein n=1 Tax=Mordavella massiliensis TaxID=1871024 RepID=UPI001959BB77